MKRTKLRRIWMGGTGPEAGVHFFEVDPELEPDETIVDLAGVEEPPVCALTPIETAAFCDMTRIDRGEP